MLALLASLVRKMTEATSDSCKRWCCRLQRTLTRRRARPTSVSTSTTAVDPPQVLEEEPCHCTRTPAECSSCASLRAELLDLQDAQERHENRLARLELALVRTQGAARHSAAVQVGTSPSPTPGTSSSTTPGTSALGAGQQIDGARLE